MDEYISFSELNDFLFCPYSLYLHVIYKNYSTSLYHDTYQIDGKAAHTTIDQDTYKKGGWQTGVWACSSKLVLYGRCDLYNPDLGELVERKRTIHTLFEGHKLQVWAQAICLIEMGKQVKGITIHSLTDNTKYRISVPDDSIVSRLSEIIRKIRKFDPNFYKGAHTNKCAHCIYSHLCPFAQQIEDMNLYVHY